MDIDFKKFSHLQTMPKIPASEARTGRRYYTAKGVHVEAAAPRGNGDPLKPDRDSEGNIFVWVVKPDGELDRSQRFPIPAGYALYDTTPVLPKEPGKRGRKVHLDKTWRSWAFENPNWGESILKLADGQKFTFRDSANYISVVWYNKKVLTIFRAGILGFGRNLPQEFQAYPVLHDQGAFCPQRIKWVDCHQKGLMLNRVLKDLTVYFEKFRGANVPPDLQSFLREKK